MKRLFYTYVNPVWVYKPAQDNGGLISKAHGAGGVGDLHGSRIDKEVLQELEVMDLYCFL